MIEEWISDFDGLRIGKDQLSYSLEVTKTPLSGVENDEERKKERKRNQPTRRGVL